MLWNVRSFGHDCLGNISGYIVERYVANQREIAGTFVGNIYEPGSFGRAKVKAVMLAAKLNPPVIHQSTD